MSKYINLEKQLVRLYQLGIKDEEVIKQFLLTACTEDVEKVRHGRWIDAECYSEGCDDGYICSECRRITYRIMPPYCPYCGAKMDEENNG